MHLQVPCLSFKIWRDADLKPLREFLLAEMQAERFAPVSSVFFLKTMQVDYEEST